MNFDHENTDGCEEISSDLIEFATGTLTGRSRTRVLEHLATCAHCRSELESLAAVADALLELAPAAEPPGRISTTAAETASATTSARPRPSSS